MIDTALHVQNSAPFVVTSIVVAITTSYAALDLASRLRGSDGGARLGWLLAGATAMGIGIWSMHFVAMLGLRLPLAVAYDGRLVALSIAVAIAASAIGLGIVARDTLSAGSLGGHAVAMGLAIAGMHYIGMAAMRVNATVQYDPWLVAASCAIAISASAVALWLAVFLRDERRGRQWERLGAAIVMGFAIAGMHYTGMAAVHFIGRSPTDARTTVTGVESSALLLLTLTGTGVVLLGVLFASALHRRVRTAGPMRVLPPRLLWTALGLTFVAVVALGTLNWQSASRKSELDVRRRALEGVVSDLRYLDEAIANAARLGAMTSQPAWKARYDSLKSPLDSAVAELDTLAASFNAEGSYRALTAANDDLYELEAQALAARTPADGVRVLDDRRYARAAARYRDALATLNVAIGAGLAAQARALQRDRILSIVIGAGTVILLGLAWAGILLLTRAFATEQQGRAAESALARESADAANRSKSEFLASMSHELRTPLTAVIGFANILFRNKGGRLSLVELNYVARIKAGGEHLLGLINEILDLARLESGHVDVVVAPTELTALVHAAAAVAESRSDDERLRLVLDLPPHEVWISTDAGKLSQVIINLVGNAIKFTAAGTVTIALVPAGAEAGGARITVSDTGRGIPADRLEAIFLPFEQADNTAAREYGGTGLGLSISRAIANALGATLTATSVPGQGSAFTIELPRSTSLAVQSGPARGHEPAGAGSRTSDDMPFSSTRERPIVLIIDDAEDARTIIAQQVREAGADVVLATSGPDGLRLARAIRPDAITLDLLMPGMSGFDVLRELKRDTTVSHVPVIVVSVAGRELGSLLGAVDVLTKPLAPAELQDALGRHLGQQGTGQCDVLVVEAQDGSGPPLRTSLESAGVRHVHSAPDANAAMAMLDRCSPHLVLIDLLMPEAGALALLRSLRLDVRWVHLPVIIVSAREPTEREARMLHRESVAVLGKSDDISERLPRLLRNIVPGLERHPTRNRRSELSSTLGSVKPLL